MNSKKIWIITIVCLVLLAMYEALFPLPPQTILIRYFALAGFFLLSLCLLIGPMVVCFKNKCGPLIKHRKRIGELSFIFVLIHFVLVFVYSYDLNITYVFSDLQLVLALVALMILFLLTITSANKMIQKMGFSRWKLLQRFVYVAFAFSFIHFLLDTNGLFIPFSGGRTFVNLAEVLLISLGVITIIFQYTGFILRKASAKKGKIKP